MQDKETRPKLKREPMAIPPRTPIVVPREDIERRWAEVKRRERQRRGGGRGSEQQNIDQISYFHHHHSPVRQSKTALPGSEAKEAENNVSLWFELNKRPWREYYQHLDHLDRYCLFSPYNNNNNNTSYCSSPLLFSAAAAAQLQLHKLPPDWHIRASSPRRLQRTHSDPDSIFDRWSANVKAHVCRLLLTYTHTLFLFLFDFVIPPTTFNYHRHWFWWNPPVAFAVIFNFVFSFFLFLADTWYKSTKVSVSL